MSKSSEIVGKGSEEHMSQIVLATRIESRGDAILFVVSIAVTAVVLLLANSFLNRAKHPEGRGRSVIQLKTGYERRRAARSEKTSGAHAASSRTGLTASAAFALCILLLATTRTAHGLSRQWYVIVLAGLLFLTAAVLAICALIQSVRARQER